MLPTSLVYCAEAGTNIYTYMSELKINLSLRLLIFFYVKHILINLAVLALHITQKEIRVFKNITK